MFDSALVNTLDEIIKKDNTNPEIKQKAKDILYNLAGDQKEKPDSDEKKEKEKVIFSVINQDLNDLES